MERAFEPVKSVTVRPFAEMIWGDAARYRRIYGESPSYRFLNGSFMVGTMGMIAEWRITKNWYLWGRFRQFITINKEARSLAHKRDTIVVTDVPEEFVENIKKEQEENA